MRLICLLICGVIIVSSADSVYAQTRGGDHEICLGGGVLSGTEILGFHFLASGSTDGQYYRQTAMSGTWFASYRYSLNEIVSIGISAGIQSFSFAHYNDDYAAEIPDFTLTGTVVTLAVEFKAIYPRLNKRHFQVYALTGLGGSVYDEKVNDNPRSLVNPTGRPRALFNSQWTPVGFRIGGNLAGFLELGYGYKGILNAGICYRFTKYRYH